MNKSEKKTILSGLSDIMFDQFYDHSKQDRSCEQKLYLNGSHLVLPSENIYSFLLGDKGCAKKFEGKKSGDYISIGHSHIFIKPNMIPFLDHKNNPIQFKEFDNKRFSIFTASPVVKVSGRIVKRPPKGRPVLHLPWKLSFDITLIENNLFDMQKLHNWFIEGGIVIGLGTYRPRFGRFEVEKFE